MTALTSDLNYASLFYIVVIVRAGIFCSESVVLRCIRQLCGILAVLFGYRDVVVTGDSEQALGRDTGNRQLNRAAAGKGRRSCLDSDCRSSLFSPLGVIGRASNRLIVIGQLGPFGEIAAGIPASECVAGLNWRGQRCVAGRIFFKCAAVGYCIGQIAWGSSRSMIFHRSHNIRGRHINNC